MSTNKVYDGDTPLSMAVASTVASGDPVLVGQIAAVAETNYRSSDGKATLVLRGVYDLSVKGANDAGNVAVAVGDAIYFVTGDTPVLSKKASGVFFGYALEVVTSGSTTTINVLLPGPSAQAASAFAGGGFFLSAEITGTGASQATAHGLGAAPSKVVIVPTEFASNISYDSTLGTHTTTNVVTTVTSGAKYVVMAWKD